MRLDNTLAGSRGMILTFFPERRPKPDHDPGFSVVLALWEPENKGGNSRAVGLPPSPSRRHLCMAEDKDGLPRDKGIHIYDVRLTRI